MNSHETRAKKAVYVKHIRKLLSETPMTTAEMCELFNLKPVYLRRYRLAADTLDEWVYVHAWIWDTEDRKWKAQYMYGTGTDVPRPPRLTESELNRKYREKLRADPVRWQEYRSRQNELAGKYREAKNAKRRAARASARAEREKQNRATIAPVVDPWAHMLFGGASLIARSQA